ncbi:uncharacterized protein LOC123315889 [Coccinella septempunctata]|uniref:uncharacterized protein LOC123315889 n=1 Tax=Coccinella septempunctata TaxID=41139 RepID=UPI001D05D7C5|nr:uncharacterized protein LOC123315889 [Coccinella septempunctata]
MDGLRLPPVMDFSGNMARNWSLWKQKFQMYMLAADKDEASEQVKVAILLNLIGDEGVEIYNTFKLQIEKTTLKGVMDNFEKHCQPKKNVVYERYKFLSCNQKEGQSMGSFITELKTMVKNCEYESEEEMVRDKIVMGIRDNGVRERLLQTEVLSLRKAIDVCQIAEVSRHQTDEMATKMDGTSIRVDNINSSKSKISTSNIVAW